MSKNINLVKSSKDVFEALCSRKVELNLTNRSIVRDANDKGVLLSESSLSGYFNGNPNQGNISEHAVRWLCARYCITIKMKVEREAYSEDKGLGNIKLLKLLS